MKEERAGLWPRQKKHICGHLWHIFPVKSAHWCVILHTWDHQLWHAQLRDGTFGKAVSRSRETTQGPISIPLGPAEPHSVLRPTIDPDLSKREITASSVCHCWKPNMETPYLTEASYKQSGFYIANKQELETILLKSWFVDI